MTEEVTVQQAGKGDDPESPGNEVSFQFLLHISLASTLSQALGWHLGHRQEKAEVPAGGPHQFSLCAEENTQEEFKATGWAF